MKKFFMFYVITAIFFPSAYAGEMGELEQSIRDAAIFKVDALMNGNPQADVEWLTIENSLKNNCCIYDSQSKNYASLEKINGEKFLNYFDLKHSKSACNAKVIENISQLTMVGVRSTLGRYLMVRWSENMYSIHNADGSLVKGALFSHEYPVMADQYIWGFKGCPGEGVVMNTAGAELYNMGSDLYDCGLQIIKNNILLSCYGAGWHRPAAPLKPLILTKEGKIVDDLNKITKHFVYRHSSDASLFLTHDNEEKENYLLFKSNGKWQENKLSHGEPDDYEHNYILLPNGKYLHHIYSDDGANYYELVDAATQMVIKKDIKKIDKSIAGKIKLCGVDQGELDECELIDLNTDALSPLPPVQSSDKPLPKIEQSASIKSQEVKPTDEAKEESWFKKIIRKIKEFFQRLSEKTKGFIQIVPKGEQKQSDIKNSIAVADCKTDDSKNDEAIYDQAPISVETNDAGLCGVKKNDTWLILPEFSNCNQFVNNVAVLERNGLLGVVDKNGNWLTHKPEGGSYFTAQWRQKIKQGVQPEPGYGAINEHGDWVVPPAIWRNERVELELDALVACDQFDGVLSHCKRYAFESFDAPSDVPAKKISTTPLTQFLEAQSPFATAQNNIWGFTDVENKWVVRAQFAKVSDFSEGLAAVTTDGLTWGFINAKGQEIVTQKYFEVHDFHQGVAWVKKEKWQLIDKAGKELTEEQFQEVQDFINDVAIADEGRFMVRRDGNVVRSQGLIETKNIAATLLPAHDTKGVWGYVNQQGAWVIEPKFGLALDFNNGFAIAMGAQGWHPEESQDSIVENVKFSKNQKAAYVKFKIDGEIKVAVLDTEKAKWQIPSANIRSGNCH